MKEIFKKMLFAKNILVAESGAAPDENAAEYVFVLAEKLNIRVVKGLALANKDIVDFASEQMGRDVPESFYRGFPQSVRELPGYALYLDQIVHYAKTYGLGEFEEAGHSVFEEIPEREIFNEHAPVKDFTILGEEDALAATAEIWKNDQISYFSENLLRIHSQTIEKGPVRC